MKQLTLFISLLVISSSCKKAALEHTQQVAIAIPWTDTSSKHVKNAPFKALIDKYVQRGLPGISLLIRDANGTWVGSAGKADIEKNVPFKPGQVAKVASITKLFMGALTFRMMEDSVNSGLGFSALNQPISKWIPERITNKIANGNTITLGQCMKHETGVPDLIEENKFYLGVLNNPNKKWSAEELLSFIYDKPKLFSPGDTAFYSNTNTTLVSLVMEYASGKKHSELLKQYLIQPLGLANTYYQPHDRLPNNVAQGYYDLYNDNTIVNVSNWITGSGNGYGGIYSNVFDLYKLIDALLLQKTLLKPSSLALMQTFGTTEDINQYGYGIMKKFIDRGVNYGLGHSGRDLGYSANLFYFPNKGVTHAFIINYGTDAKSNLRDVFYQFQNELIDMSLK
jgi:D-alanyl-D-alanine carboxypeptidase